MSDITDRPQAARTASGARAFARLDVGQSRARATTPSQRPAPSAGSYEAPRAEATPVETVTLAKVGDFLELDFRRLFAWLRAGIPLIVIFAILGVVAGGAFAVLATPKYTVSTDILIDPTNLQVVSDDIFSPPGQVDGQMMNAGSMLRVLTSGNVLMRVVDQLDLVNDPEFVEPPKPSLFDGLFGSKDDGPDVDPRLTALDHLSKNVGTVADETSYVATLRVTSESVAKSIALADAIFKSFQLELANAETDSAARTAAALNGRLAELKADVKTAEEAVETFKREKGLSSSAGELMSSQTMTQLNQQMVEAEANVIAAQSAYDELVAAGANASSAGTQASTTLATLRASAGALQQQLDAQSRIYGPRHPTIVRLNTELGAVNAQIRTEMGRIVAAAKTSLDEAKASLVALTNRAATMEADVFTDNDALVTLRELERDATSKSTIYEAFLTRAREVTQRERIDTTNVRVISSAVPPKARSYPPRTVILLGLGGAAGMMLGVGLAVLLGIFGDMRRAKPRRPARTAAA
ncbi:GumC family protein [Devosia sp.]|uniref:GumC family protein n=1 Tax=Devosia sp. TaxID=1871048 RepID=UPI003A937747